jgi:hypothetical protein
MKWFDLTVNIRRAACSNDLFLPIGTDISGYSPSPPLKSNKIFEEVQYNCRKVELLWNVFITAHIENETFHQKSRNFWLHKYHYTSQGKLNSLTIYSLIGQAVATI